MFQNKFSDKIQHTHFMFNYVFPENRAMYEIVWRNMIAPDTPQITIRRVRIVCWLPKTIETLRICNTYCFSTTAMVMGNRLMLRCPLFALAPSII